MARRDQRPRLYADRRRYRNKVGFMRFEESEQGRKQHRVAGSCAEFICPNSGQVEEAPPPPLIAKRCSKGREGHSEGIVWHIPRHGLDKKCII